MSFTLLEISLGLGILTCVGGLIAAGYHRYWHNVKKELETEDKRLDGNVKKLWEKKDSLVIEISQLERDIINGLHRLEMEASEKYATKSALMSAIEKFEHRLDKLRDHMDEQYNALMGKLSEIQSQRIA